MLEIASVLILASVHLFAQKLTFIQYKPRSAYLSFAGGVSVAYVFIHLLPELLEAQKFLEEDLLASVKYLENHAFLIALIGLIVFYGLERLAKIHKKKTKSFSPKLYWIHIFSFAVYNFIIGYGILHRENMSDKSLVFYSIAMALHFVVNDFGLYNHFEERYLKSGRWALTFSILLGYTAGIFIEVSEGVLIILISFISGGIILNILKEELPEEKESKFSAFLIGTLLYTVMLLAI